MANKNNQNYLARLNAARAAGEAGRQQVTETDIKKAMEMVKTYAEPLNAISSEDLKSLEELMDKVDAMDGIMSKYAGFEEKLKRIQESTALVEPAFEELKEMADDADIEPFAGYTLEQTYAITVQLIKEFEDETRLSKDLLALSENKVLEEAVPDEVSAFAGLTKEQTVQVYMQVVDEFENATETSKRLAYNSGVE